MFSGRSGIGKLAESKFASEHAGGKNFNKPVGN